MLKVATALPNEPYREYKDVERVYSNSTEIDKILDKNGNVLFAVNKEVEGTPALTYKGKEETNLKNYRIYGNTVGGESVGDRTENLFDENSDSVSGYIDDSGNISQGANPITTYDYINVTPSENYYIKICGETAALLQNRKIRIAYYSQDKRFLSRVILERVDNGATFETLNNCYYIRLSIDDGNTDIMLNEGSTPLPYEPYGYKVPVTVEGKNLINSSIYGILNIGVEYTVNNDKSITANGSTSSNFSLFLVKVYLTKGSYIISGCPQNGSQNTYRCEIRDMVLTSLAQDTGAGVTYSIVTDGYYYYSIRIAQNYVCNNLTFYPMIRKADIEDDTYEPYHAPVTTPIYLPEPIKMVGDEAEYIDYAEQKQHRVRKNLLKNTMASQIINGVTFTANEDGSITCNGTAGASAPSVLNITFTLPIELYEVSGCPDSGGNSTYRVDIRNNDSSVCNYNGNSVIDNGTGCLFDGGNNKNYCIRIAPGYTCDNLTFYPMIRKASIEDDTYEPYTEDTEVDVTLPALPVLSGTNTLTVGTEVQPSDVYLKGRIKEIT